MKNEYPSVPGNEGKPHPHKFTSAPPGIRVLPPEKPAAPLAAGESPTKVPPGETETTN
jgi:hypothetical protein